jgi:4-carboxymuconolactone decarboxylase
MPTGPNIDGLHMEMFKLGLKNRREVVGNEYVDKALENGSSEFSYAGQQLVTELVIIK